MIFFTCRYLLSSKIQHRLLIDMDIPHPLKRKALKPCPFLVLVNLDLPAGTICTPCPGFCPQESQNAQTPSILFIPDEQLSRQGKSFELFKLFLTPSNKIWNWSKTEVLSE